MSTMVNGLADCLQEANLAQYTNTFLQLGVCNLDALSALTIQEYSQFGVTDLTDKKRLFRLIHIIKSVKADKEKTPEQGIGSGKQRKGNSLQQTLHDNSGQCTPSRDNLKTSPPHSASNASEKSTMVVLGTSAKNRPSSSSRSKTSSQTKGADGLLSVARDELKKGALSPGTLRKLETKGGILFVKSTSASPKARPGIRSKVKSRKTLLLRESLSDSEITDSDFTDNPTVPVDKTNFGAPQILKKSFIEVIDHQDGTAYNYGVPSQEQTPNVRHHHAQGAPQGSGSDEGERIKVCVRKRPLNKKEEREHEVDVVQTEGRGTVVMNEAKVAVDLTKFMQVHKYHFDEVFGESCSNEEVYARTAKPLISTMFNRGKATCFAYGQTGAGKTHTMLGNGGSIRGLYLLAAEDIFNTLNASRQSGNELAVWASYFEIYCGQLFDLLNDRQRVHAREDSQHRVCIAGIREVQVSGPQTLIQVVEQGNKLRSKGVSGVNADSSRSHAILQLQLQDGGRHKLGRFSFIDLAGSERACDTVDPDRVTRYEGAEINTSLLALKECIRALDQEQRHTPFRQSKLTQVLRDSFLGHSKTCMIANIAPNSGAVDHTLNTLRYADRVKELKKETSPRPLASRYPSTPSTFSPSTTSTPLKTPSKQLPPKAQMTTPGQQLKGATPGNASPQQNLAATKKVTPVRKVSAEKASIKSGCQQQQRDARSTRKFDESRGGESNRRRNISQEDSMNRKNCETPAGKSMPRIIDAKTQRQDSAKKSSAAKKVLNVTFDSLKSGGDTPSKTDEEVKAQTKQAFLRGKSLPVWYPPEDADKPPGVPTKSQGETWDIDNPRFVHSPKIQRAALGANSKLLGDRDEKKLESELPAANETPNASKKHAQQESIDTSPTEQYSADLESGFSADDEMTETWTKRNDSSAMKHSLQTWRSDTSCSTDTDSTIELLAEIDYALRNSLVSPISDNGLCDDRTTDEHPVFGTSHGRMDEKAKCSQRHRTQSAPEPKQFPKPQSVPASDIQEAYNNRSVVGNQVLPQHAMSLHPEIRISESPDSMSTDSLQDLEVERLRQNTSSIDTCTTATKRDQSRTPVNKTEPLANQGQSSSFRSKLTVKGIESLPSPRDVQRVKPQSFSEQIQEVTSRDQGTDALSKRREQYEKFAENPSGVIVSTSFHDYVTSGEPLQTSQSEPSDLQTADASHFRPAPVGQNYTGTAANATAQLKDRVGGGLSISHNTGLQSPVTVEVLRAEQSSSAFSPVSGIMRSNQPLSVMSKPTPNRAFMKESLPSSNHQERIQPGVTPQPSPLSKEKVVFQPHRETSQQNVSQSQSDQDHPSSEKYGSSPGNKDIGGSGTTEGGIPRLQLAGMMAGGPGNTRRHLMSPRQNSAIEKAKELLVSAHAEQIDELERLCEREWRLIKQLHSGEKDLSEYLHYAKDLMTSKLRCIDTFQDQLSTFSRCSTPNVSPRSRSPMEAW